MAAAPPLRWHVDGAPGALEAAERLAADVARAEGPGLPPLPPGFAVVKDRARRVVLRGAVPGPRGDLRVYVKIRRGAPDWSRVKDRLRGPRGPAEGLVLQTLASRGVAAVLPVAWSGDGVDVLVVEALDRAVDLGTWARAVHGRAERVEVARAVGRLLRAAHEAGWSDRDVHRGNLLIAPEGPVLLDPGTQPLRGPLSAPRRVAALGLAAHGLAPDLRSGLRALRAYLDEDREAARRWLRLVAGASRHVARAYRRGRSRRATRTGRHFEVFEPAGPRTTAVRSIDRAPAAWRAVAADLLRGDPEGSIALKADGSVRAARLPGHEGVVVVKRWAPTWRDRFRVPRPVRAFRRAYALRVRGVSCPEPLLAAAGSAGEGVYVAAHAGPAGEASTLDLDRATRAQGGAASAYERLAGPDRRRALERLGRFLRRLHDAEVTHRDLKAPNLVGWRSPHGFSFAVVDLEGARVRRGPVPWKRRARDLARLDASVGSPPVSRADRLRVLFGYLASFERPGLSLKAMARRVARASARKRGPSGRPR